MPGKTHPGHSIDMQTELLASMRPQRNAGENDPPSAIFTR